MTNLADALHPQAAAIGGQPLVSIIGSGAPVTCGVMDYARQLVHSVERLAPGLVEIVTVEPGDPAAFVDAIVSRLRDDRIVHLQLPIEGWGNAILPGSALMLARLATRRGLIVMTLHEWLSLNQLRYLSIIPDLLATDAFVFVSEQQRQAFQRSPLVPRAKRRAAMMLPIGPNIMAVPLDAQAVADERATILGCDADLAICFFGVLYASKRPELLLETLAVLRARGIRAKLVICGDFLHDKPADRQAFIARAEALGVLGHLDLRGRIDRHDELMTVLSACDLFLMPYSDGISARRGTFHAVAQLARPLVSTKPERPDEFDAFPALATKVASLATVLVPTATGADGFADAVIEAHANRGHAQAVDLTGLWDEAARGHIALYRSLAAGSIPLPHSTA